MPTNYEQIRFDVRLTKGTHLLEWIYQRKNSTQIENRSVFHLNSFRIEGEEGFSQMCVKCPIVFFMEIYKKYRENIVKT